MTLLEQVREIFNPTAADSLTKPGTVQGFADTLTGAGFVHIMLGVYGSCFFLTELDVERAASDSDLLDQAEESFLSYVDNHCEETNWGENQALLLDSGKVVPVAGTDAGGDTEITALLAQPVNERWDYMIDRALELLLRELKVDAGFSPDEELLTRFRREKVVSAVRSSVPGILARAYRQLGAAGGQVSEGDHRRRQRLAEMYELFLSSELHPFSRILRSPNVYPSYDLSRGKGNAMLITAINRTLPGLPDKRGRGSNCWQNSIARALE